MKRRYRPEGYKCRYCPEEDPRVFPTPQSLGGHVTSVHTLADLDRILAEKERLKKKREGKSQ